MDEKTKKILTIGLPALGVLLGVAALARGGGGGGGSSGLPANNQLDAYGASLNQLQSDQVKANQALQSQVNQQAQDQSRLLNDTARAQEAALGQQGQAYSQGLAQLQQATQDQFRASNQHLTDALAQQQSVQQQRDAQLMDYQRQVGQAIQDLSGHINTAPPGPAYGPAPTQPVGGSVGQNTATVPFVAPSPQLPADLGGGHAGSISRDAATAWWTANGGGHHWGIFADNNIHSSDVWRFARHTGSLPASPQQIVDWVHVNGRG